MSQHFISRRLVRFVAGCVLGLACAALLPSAANRARAKDPWKGFTYEEAASCKQCHGLPTQDYSEKGNLDLVLMAEYPIWKTHDKHAQAYAVLEGPRGELGYYVVSNGDNRPWRVRTRPPSMYNLQVLKKIAVGELIADMVVMIGSLDPVFGEVDR